MLTLEAKHIHTKFFLAGLETFQLTLTHTHKRSELRKKKFQRLKKKSANKVARWT
jgi:hypothetical protein